MTCYADLKLAQASIHELIACGHSSGRQSLPIGHVKAKALLVLRRERRHGLGRDRPVVGSIGQGRAVFLRKHRIGDLHGEIGLARVPFGMKAAWVQNSSPSFGRALATGIPSRSSAARIGIQPYITQASPLEIKIDRLTELGPKRAEILFLRDQEFRDFLQIRR